MEQAKRVAKNTGFLYARMAITVLISLYVTRLILAALGTEDFGIYNVVAGIVAMLVFLNAAMTEASQRFMSFAQGEGNHNKQKQIFNVSIILHLVIAFIVVILIELVGYFLFDSVLQIPEERMYAAKSVFHFMVISTFFAIITVPYDAIINAHENMFLFAILGVIESLFKLGIALFITYSSQDKLFLYGFLMAGLAIIMLLFRAMYCHKKYIEVDINVRLYFDKQIYKEMANFASWSLLGSSTSMVANYGQGIVLNSFFGPIVNASQGIANQVSGQLGAFSLTMLKALSPVIVKSEGAGDRQMMLNASMIGTKISFFLLVFFYVPILIDMPYIFSLWLKEVPEYAVVFCRLLLIRNLIEILFFTVSSTIGAVGDIKHFKLFSSLLNIAPLIVTIILFSFGYPAYSIYLVFIGYSILNSFIILFFAKEKCNLPVSIFMKQIVARSILVFCFIFIFALLSRLFQTTDLIRLFITIFISSVAFAFFVWFIGLTIDERKGIIKVLIKRI